MNLILTEIGSSKFEWRQKVKSQPAKYRTNLLEENGTQVMQGIDSRWPLLVPARPSVATCKAHPSSLSFISRFFLPAHWLVRPEQCVFTFCLLNRMVLHLWFIMVSSYGAGSVDTDCHHSKKLRVSRGLVAASVLCLIAWILLLIAFASPYWLSSYAITYSPFVRLGLWDFCFNSYRHPPYQYDEKFTGCHWVYSAKFQNIRDWLQPGKLIVV